MNKYGVIFDMDGVISDTQRLHASTESRALADLYGLEILPDAITERFAGTKETFLFGTLLNEHGLVGDPEKLIARKWKFLERHVANQGIEAIEGVLNLIAALAEHPEFATAVASASPKHFIERVLRALDIESDMNAVHSTHEVERGKPAPDVFLLAAQSLNTEPRHCLVIEDGRSGMTAAKSAGMKCIGLVSDTAGDYPADMLVTSLTDVTPSVITELFAIGH